MSVSALTRAAEAVAATASIAEAAELMSGPAGMPALPVVDSRGRVLGVVTEAAVRQFAAAGGAPEPGSDEPWAVADVMVVLDEVPSAATELHDLAALMVHYDLPMLPVARTPGGLLGGVVSQRDLLAALVEQQPGEPAGGGIDAPGWRVVIESGDVTVGIGVAAVAQPDRTDIDTVCADLDALRVERRRRRQLRWPVRAHRAGRPRAALVPHPVDDL